MKKVLLLAFLFVSSLHAYAQLAGNCGFIATDEFMERTLSNKKNYEKFNNIKLILIFEKDKLSKEFCKKCWY